MSKRVIATQRLTVDLSRMEQRVHAHGESHTRVPDGTLTGTVHLSVDVDGLLAELGAKALRNRSKRARDVGGLIEAIVDPKSLTRVKP